MLTPKQKAAIRAEEVFRAEIRNEIASAGRLQKPRRKLWEVLNSSLVIWFLTSVVVALISYLISNAALNRERDETQRRLKWEVYNNGLQFEHAFKGAWTRFEYETALGQHLQHPKARVVDLKPFSFDRITFEMEYVSGDDFKTLREAPHDVWDKIEKKLGKRDDNWYIPLDVQTKTELDKDINSTVQEKIIEPFRVTKRS
jgi:hypothetical protein